MPILLHLTLTFLNEIKLKHPKQSYFVVIYMNIFVLPVAAV